MYGNFYHRHVLDITRQNYKQNAEIGYKTIFQ